MYNKKNDQLFIYGPRCDTNEHFFILGGGGGGGPGNAWGMTSIIGLGLSLCASIISLSNMEAI